jgi:hypothetical protein
MRGAFVRAFKMVVLTLTTCLAFAFAASGQVHERYEGWCSTLEAASSPDLVQFLNATVPDEQNARCVTWAINKVGKERYEPAITALVRLLDFRRPEEEREKTVHGLSRGLFPAKVALELIGKKALPEVLHAIKVDTSSDAARQNALDVWMEIYRESDENPKGVADLKQEEAKVSDEKSKARLKWAVERAVAHCNSPEQAACRKAAATGSP